MCHCLIALCALALQGIEIGKETPYSRAPRLVDVLAVVVVVALLYAVFSVVLGLLRRLRGTKSAPVKSKKH